jgi:hypothetical protein
VPAWSVAPVRQVVHVVEELSVNRVAAEPARVWLRTRSTYHSACQGRSRCTAVHACSTSPGEAGLAGPVRGPGRQSPSCRDACDSSRPIEEHLNGSPQREPRGRANARSISSASLRRKPQPACDRMRSHSGAPPARRRTRGPTSRRRLQRVGLTTTTTSRSTSDQRSGVPARTDEHHPRPARRVSSRPTWSAVRARLRVNSVLSSPGKLAPAPANVTADQHAISGGIAGPLLTDHRELPAKCP